MSDSRKKIEDAVSQLKDSIREDVRANEWVGSEEYFDALDDAVRKVVKKVVVYMTEEERGDELLPVIRAIPTSVWQMPEDAAFNVTLESLLDDLDEEEQLPVWLDEMERLLKLHGRR